MTETVRRIIIIRKGKRKTDRTFRNRQQDRMEEWVKIQELLGKEKNGVGNEDENSDCDRSILRYGKRICKTDFQAVHRTGRNLGDCENV